MCDVNLPCCLHVAAKTLGTLLKLLLFGFSIIPLFLVANLYRPVSLPSSLEHIWTSLILSTLCTTPDTMHGGVKIESPSNTWAPVS